MSEAAIRADSHYANHRGLLRWGREQFDDVRDRVARGRAG